ncbi:hypothetical protein [Rhodococcus tukisamuensis]|uniref:hypothetical protein n=1 Tax=Rhodococcus tukisamuensis TaxID=168276 RepID=UPI0011146894|nr:hypothetical protein [Rhodococcus tukisamuensis]
MEAKTLAAPWLRDERFDLIDLPPQDLESPAATEEAFDEERRSVDERIRRGDLAAALYRVQVDLSGAKDDNVSETVSSTYQYLKQATVDGDKLFPDLSAHLVSVDVRLYTRSKLPAILLRLDQDPLFIDDIRSGRAGQSTDSLMFGSNSDLFGSGVLTDTFLGPLFACRSPLLWAVHGQRLLGTVVFNLGKMIPGVTPHPVEPLQLLPRTAPISWPGTANNELPSQRWADAIDWWVLKLDQMFACLSDPSNFSDANGSYLPYHHQNWLMNIQELFSRVTSTMLSWRDAYATRISPSAP